MISDAEKEVGIAGIMGGENSKITDDVKTMLFECATFDGTNIRLSAKKVGFRTDASGKYEKGLDPNTAEEAVNRACQLIEELGAGEVVGGMVDVYPVKAAASQAGEIPVPKRSTRFWARTLLQGGPCSQYMEEARAAATTRRPARSSRPPADRISTAWRISPRRWPRFYRLRQDSPPPSLPARPPRESSPLQAAGGGRSPGKCGGVLRLLPGHDLLLREPQGVR